jgi:hypothetical protein
MSASELKSLEPELPEFQEPSKMIPVKATLKRLFKNHYLKS